MKKIIILYISLMCYHIGSAQVYDTKDFALPGVDSVNEVTAAIDPIFHKYVAVSARTNRMHDKLGFAGGWIWNQQFGSITTDGGKSWQGRPKIIFLKSAYSGLPLLGISRYPINDGTFVIGSDGRYYLASLSNGNMSFHYTNDQGGRWFEDVPQPNFRPFGSLIMDKPHACTDIADNSPYKGTTYLIGVANTGSQCGPIRLNYTRDGGATWLNNDANGISKQITTPPDPDPITCQMNITTGKNGTVYITGIYNSLITFTKSTDGGQTFTNKIINPTPLRPENADIQPTCDIGYPTNFLSQTTISNPVILADISDAPGNNSSYSRIYVVFGAFSFTSGYNVYYMKSTDDGTTWSTPSPVSPSIPSGKSNFLPWSSIDPETGALSVIYFSNRNQTANCTYDTYVASSTDGGNTWADTKVGDFAFDLSKSGYLKTFLMRNDGEVFQEFYSRGRFGEYNSIVSSNGVVYPFWMDTRSTTPMLYSSPFVLPACDTTLSATKNLTTPISDTIIKEKASSVITATNNIGSGSKAKYVAGELIELNPGFETNISTNPADKDFFSAYINQGCATPQAISKFAVRADGPVCSGNTLQLEAEDIAAISYAWTGPNGFSSTLRNPQIANVEAVHTGAYTCTATLLGGGTISASVQVMVKQTPNKVFIIPPADQCNYTYPLKLQVQHTTALSPTLLWMHASFSDNDFRYVGINNISVGGLQPGAALGLASSVNPLIIPTSSYPGPGKYKCRVFNEGCFAETPIFTIYPASGLTIAQSGSFCSSGVTIQINQLSIYGNNPTVLWTGPNGYSNNATTIFLSSANQNVAGTYTCTLTTSNGCTFQTNFTIAACGGRISQTNQPLEVKPVALKVFPNPSNGTFYVEANALLEKATILVTDAAGKTVYANNLAGKSKVYTVNLPPSITAGLYTVTVRHSQGQSSVRLMVGTRLGGAADDEKENNPFNNNRMPKEKR